MAAISRHLGEAALLAEGDSLLEGGERAGRALERVAGDGEVVLQDGGVPAGALFEHQCERLLHLGEPVGVAEVSAGEAVEAKRARRRRQPEPLGQRQGLVGGGDRLRIGAGEELGAASCV